MRAVSRAQRIATLSFTLIALAASDAARQASAEAPVRSEEAVFEVLVTAKSSETERTLLVVPRSTASRAARAVDPKTVVTLIVAQVRSPRDDAVVVDRFAKEMPQGRTHLRLDLPEGILGVDVHDPAQLSVDRLKRLVGQNNMETFAAFQFKDAGKALYVRLYAEFAAFIEATAVQAVPIGEFDTAGKVTMFRR